MTTADSLLDELDAVAGSFALHLRTRDVARGVDVLRQVADAVRSTVRDGVVPLRTSPVAPLPDGPIVRLDDLPTDPLTRRRVADIVDDLVAEAGFERGAAVLCEVDGLADLDDCPRAVVLRLFPSPRGRAGHLPAGWIDLAAEWVFGDQDPETVVRLRVLGVEASVMVKEAAGILHGCARARAWCDVVTGDVAGRVRTASITFGVAPHVAVAAGGPRCDDAGLLARFELLADVARDHAAAASHGRAEDRVAYACLDFEDTFGGLGTGLSSAPWADESGASPNRVAGRLVDRRIPEVFAFQVLGPGHVAALGDEGRDLRPIGDDRWELALGEPEDWLPATALRDEVRREGWQLLAPLLVRDADLDDELADAGASADPTAPAGAGAGDEAWATGLPDLSTIVIEPHSHPRRGSRLSVLELAAWLAGEPHSDDPANVAPVLRVYARELAAGIDDPLRQTLRDRASRLAATGRADAAIEQRRSWVLADRLLRLHASTWLGAAGLSESADRLRTLESIATDTQLVRGVHLLGNAIGTASRRLETTRAIAGERADLVDALAWEIWEDVCQRSGGAAIAEAVVHGVPGSLTFATDQRVMELSRDPDHRVEVETSTRGLGDEVWSTALAEVAATAWRTGWAAAEAFVHHESTFSVRTTLRRTLQEILADDDDIALDMLLDDIDTTARDTIARLLLVGDDESDYWDKAMAACATVDGGQDWLRAVEETRAVLGPSLCDEAIQMARDQVGEWAARAPELVSRAVVASVTREACSIAGRGVIARVAAEALARGASEAEAEAAALDAVAALTGTLGEDAVAVLDELVELDR
ncbi:hypothetical protein NHL50_18515 [Acidimicrobiia bacterium EGI L10123]|uniref:hypothetical protein n=1 Tax=Salinilacustrithrix flava TaxID=2957203 RepID=UPI003D7C21C2|nr:hypothetical protein [Acidimicrobiia bacterium EGI L10123]